MRFFVRFGCNERSIKWDLFGLLYTSGRINVNLPEGSCYGTSRRTSVSENRSGKNQGTCGLESCVDRSDGKPKRISSCDRADGLCVGFGLSVYTSMREWLEQAN